MSYPDRVFAYADTQLDQEWAEAVGWMKGSDPEQVLALQQLLCQSNSLKALSVLSPIEAEAVCRLAGLALKESCTRMFRRLHADGEL